MRLQIGDQGSAVVEKSSSWRAAKRARIAFAALGARHGTRQKGGRAKPRLDDLADAGTPFHLLGQALAGGLRDGPVVQTEPGQLEGTCEWTA